MALNRRRAEILKLIQEDGHAKVQQLSQIFGVSEVTIRQDLEALEELGYVQREHGGAFLKDVGSFAETGTLFNQEHLEEKQEIALKAVNLIEEGDSIILDSGSTTTALASQLLKFKSLTVITNALNIAFILGKNPGINLVVSGGEFKAPTLSLTGELAVDVFKKFHVKKLFLATAGISPEYNLTYPSFSDLVVKSAMIESAEKVFLLADSFKIGLTTFATLGPITRIHTLITDSKISAEAVEKLQGLGVEVL